MEHELCILIKNNFFNNLPEKIDYKDNNCQSSNNFFICVLAHLTSIFLCILIN